MVGEMQCLIMVLPDICLRNCISRLVCMPFFTHSVAYKSRIVHPTKEIMQWTCNLVKLNKFMYIIFSASFNLPLCYMFLQYLKPRNYVTLLWTCELLACLWLILWSSCMHHDVYAFHGELCSKKFFMILKPLRMNM